MTRYLAALAVWAALGVSSAHAAAADLYSIAGVSVDATAPSATSARDVALVQGRPIAWQRLFRRLTPPDAWSQQPRLDDATLLRIIRSFEVANERRSTTRYLADITYHFNADEVRGILRQAGIRYTETRSQPVLIVPLVDGLLDLDGPWARAWAAPAVADGLVPVIFPTGDDQDLGILSRPDLDQLDWEELSPLAQRYSVEQIVIADAAPDGNAAYLVDVSPTGRQAEALAFADSSFLATADAAASKLAESWKTRTAVDYRQRAQLTADVAFAAPGDWPRIEARLAAIGAIADVDVLGVSLREARVRLTYHGGPEQLRDALSQQDLDFRSEPGGYLLRLGAAAGR